MVVIDSIDEGLALTIRVEVPCDFFEDSPVEILCDDLSVEAVDFKLHIIFQLSTIEDFTGNRVVNSKLFALLIVDTLNTQFGADIVWRIVIYQIAVNDSLTVRIVKNRLSEDFGSVQRRCCSQRNFHGVKVLDDGAVFADIVILVTVEHFRLAHFFVQNISTVCFVNHN